MDTIAERIDLALSKRGLSKRQAARESGIAKGWLSNAINDPKVSTLEKLAEALRVPPEWLAFGSGKEPKWGRP
jgi:transcriptional regulator with XRE-family HTH domain